jgi:hypothetical protein
MHKCRLALPFAFTLLTGACMAAPDLPPVKPYDAAALSAVRYKAVLVAGDGRLPVFDNAVEGVARRLRERAAVPEDDIQRLSASSSVIAQDGVRSASSYYVLNAIERMAPGPGQGCFVFATSHGIAGQGLLLSTMQSQTLTPKALDGALARGCGNAPTIVVVSGCYTGTFSVAPMTRANRVILTASRSDRTSFGCGAGKYIYGA